MSRSESSVRGRSRQHKANTVPKEQATGSWRIDLPATLLTDQCEPLRRDFTTAMGKGFAYRLHVLEGRFAEPLVSLQIIGDDQNQALDCGVQSVEFRSEGKENAIVIS